MKIAPAGPDDIAVYVALAREAEVWVRSRGLEQYVPAAHDEYANAIRSRVDAGNLYVVREGDAAVAFFSLDDVPPRWWTDGEPALYLAGMVVDPKSRGRGVGGRIIEWSGAECRQRGKRFLRLDCHAGNPWLSRYYESHGFEPIGRVEQHPGYDGCLYQRAVEPLL